jgi:hypothetical protein
LAWMSDPDCCCCSRAGACEPCHHHLETGMVLLKCFWLFAQLWGTQMGVKKGAPWKWQQKEEEEAIIPKTPTKNQTTQTQVIMLVKTLVTWRASTLTKMRESCVNKGCMCECVCVYVTLGLCHLH